jgi:hypothetical protein
LAPTSGSRNHLCVAVRSLTENLEHRLENNHIELRYILPKESDLFALGLTGQKPLDLICAHLNSVAKESLHGKSHFDCLSFFAPELFERFFDYVIFRAYSETMEDFAIRGYSLCYSSNGILKGDR